MVLGRKNGNKNLHYAYIVKDEAGDLPVYGPVNKVPHLYSFKTSENKSSWTDYSDNIVENSGETVSSIGVEMVLGATEDATIAALTGKNYDPSTGLMATGKNTTQPYLALMWEQTREGSSSDYRVLYKIKLATSDIETVTQEDGATHQTIKLTGTAVPLTSTEIIEALLVCSRATHTHTLKYTPSQPPHIKPIELGTRRQMHTCSAQPYKQRYTPSRPTKEGDGIFDCPQSNTDTEV